MQRLTSWEGFVDCGVGIGTKSPPLQAAIEKAQGGNPLDFKLGNAASVRVPSTSLNDQHPEQFVTRFLFSFGCFI
ncbi:hypothetical protein Vadar_022109 [Vaccinium darrowii]|uniref:Uncharacterized protein n=1 Tax=Vaccinium darrowii TaxID=229202 RepID=A0ACB7XBJ8_9ERIC|nr:hypothetical protein Vadar_022109 [Vaccinium darrowii]